MADDISGEQSRIEAKLRSALKRLDVTSQFIVQSIFGVLGCQGLSCQKVAQREEVSQETIEGLQADALRALMGYGSKAPARDNDNQAARGRKSSAALSDTIN